LIVAAPLGIVRKRGKRGSMRIQVVVVLGLAALVAGCGGGGWFGSKSKPDAAAAAANEITKPIGPGFVARCPVPVAYDDATTHKIQEALDALPKDNVLRKIMSDYEAERDNLRMCQ
jgi:hypothetical protein